ncbi:MAG: hypothetical protein RMK29_19095 [Myxococcales bacterium]|nr:hypothetical protein [Myxococcota bacterium]MDW8283812.1 hypothetical protein [Myxococcales bacterium]
MPADLTAILLPLPPRGPTPDEILRTVTLHSPPAVWVRLVPLAVQGLHQLEVLEGPTGLPCVAPQLVAALSAGDRKALFLHVNHEAKQALIHAFEGGVEVATFVGEPGQDCERELERLVGWSVDELVAADDGTRIGFGQAASRTAALVRGRLLAVPPGTPTAMDSFAFHDRGHDRPRQSPAASADGGAEGEEEAIRVAFFAYDHELICRAWNEMPGVQLAQVIRSAPPEGLGPLFPLREEVANALARLEVAPGTLAEQPPAHLRAFEMLALSHAGVYAGGDTARYVSERLLPLLAIGDVAPVLDGPQEAEELEAMDSVLAMMVEVLPCPRPPGGYGPILESLGEAELGALVPWAQGHEYEGTIFRVQPDRLLGLVRSLDGPRLGARLDRFCRALYEARFSTSPLREDGTPTEAYLSWRRGIEERSAADLDRFLNAWAELRVVLEIAALNRLAVGMIIYGA